MQLKIFKPDAAKCFQLQVKCGRDAALFIHELSSWTDACLFIELRHSLVD